MRFTPMTEQLGSLKIHERIIPMSNVSIEGFDVEAGTVAEACVDNDDCATLGVSAE